MGAEGVPGFHARLLPCSGADSEYTAFAGIRVSLLSFPGHTDVALVSWLCFCHGIDAAAVYCMAGEFVCPDPTLDDGGWPYRNARRFGSVSRIADAIAISAGVVSDSEVVPYTIPLVIASLVYYGVFRGISPSGPRLWIFSGLGAFRFWSSCSGVRRSGHAGVAWCFALRCDGRPDSMGLL